jgi:hypothetical protein
LAEKEAESALKLAEKEAESALKDTIIAALLSGKPLPTASTPLPTASTANVSFDLGAVKEWLVQIKQGRGRFLKLPDTKSEAVNVAMRRVRDFSALFEVYDAVLPADSYAIIRMKDCGRSICKCEGFEVWRRLSVAEKYGSLNQVVLGLVRLCHAGWVNYDCRLANIVIDKDGKLTAIDLDWIQAVNAFNPPVNQHSFSLWYPDCSHPMLYLAWQAYVCAELLLRCDSLQCLQELLARLDKSDQDWWGDSFEEFEQRMKKSGWTGKDPPKFVVGLVLGGGNE